MQQAIQRLYFSRVKAMGAEGKEGERGWGKRVGEREKEVSTGLKGKKYAFL